MGPTLWPDELESQLFSMLNNDDRQITGCSPKETSSQMLEPLGLEDETALGASEVQLRKASSEPSNGLLAWQPVVRIGAWVRAWVSGLLHTKECEDQVPFGALFHCKTSMNTRQQTHGSFHRRHRCSLRAFDRAATGILHNQTDHRAVTPADPFGICWMQDCRPNLVASNRRYFPHIPLPSSPKLSISPLCARD